MRSSVAILLLTAANAVSAQDIVPTTAGAASAGNPTEMTLSRAREVLERWERVLTEEGSERISDSYICRMYLDAWATVDLGRAIELEQKHRCRRSQSLLARRLAAAHRWDEMQTLMDDDPEEFRNLAPEYWARVACYGAKIGDIDIVELAGRHVERIAAAEPSEVEGPPRPSERVALARFYVAASRLDVLRRRFGTGLELDTGAARSQSEQALSREQSKELRIAVDDLRRAAGGFVQERPDPWMRSFYIRAIEPEFGAFEEFAALESWEMASNQFALPETDNFVHPLVETFHRERPSAPHCRPDMVLPDLSHWVTSAWLTRQIMLGRVSVALTTLWMAPGSDVVRARNLAVMSRYLPADEEVLAASWREAADTVLESVPVMDDSTVRALAELSLAYSSAGDFENASRCIDRTFSAGSAGDEEKPDWATNYQIRQMQLQAYQTRRVLLQAVAALPEAHPRIPEVLEKFPDRFERARLADYRFEVDGMTRHIDLTRTLPDSRILEEKRNRSHADYHEPHDAGNWLRAMEAAVRHHAGNPAWARNYRTLAEESVREIGLEATLDWCRDISDGKARFAAEIAAVCEAVRPWRRTLPGIDADNPEFVTPAVLWPSGC